MSRIDTLRKKIAALQAERETLSTQKRSRAEVATILDGMVTQWATAGHASLTRELEKAALGEPAEPLSLRGVVNIGPLMVAMLGTDTVKTALMGYLGTLPEGTATAPRLARLQAIAVELDQLETDEESMVEANGLERRTDARPEIVLAVA